MCSRARGWLARIDAKAQLAYLVDGTTISYDKCLIATGGKPKDLRPNLSPFLAVDSKVNLHVPLGTEGRNPIWRLSGRSR